MDKNNNKIELFVKLVIIKIKERTILTLYPQIKLKLTNNQILKMLTMKRNKKILTTKTTTLMF